MPVAYSYDLRKKALEMLNKGYFKEDVCETLEISLSSLNLWLKRKKEGCLKPKKLTGGPKSKILDLEKFEEFLNKNSDKTLKELAELWGGVSPMAIHRTIRKIGYTFKKKVFYTKKDLKKSEKYIWSK